MSYIRKVIHDLNQKHGHEVEYVQAVTHVLTTLEPLIEANETTLQKHAIIERLITPEKQFIFRVPWVDASQQVQVNMGYRVQFNSALGPYKGGIRFHPSVNLSVVKFLAFEQSLKNALTGLPLGGGKGGADFDPKGKSDFEIMSFCQSYMTVLSKHIGANSDVPAGDIGVGEKEVGYMFGQYKRLQNVFEGVFTGKGIAYGGSLVRKEATGYGLLYITQAMLQHHGMDIKGMRVSVSGAGNVAQYAIKKAQMMGAHVITCSDSQGWLHDEKGIDLPLLQSLKNNKKGSLSEYTQTRTHATYHVGKGVWSIATDIALPCATQNELSLEDAQMLVSNGCKAVAEGANKPLTLDAVTYLHAHGILYLPSKAANAGGVSLSALEMSQNSMREQWSFERCDARLQEIMEKIFEHIKLAAQEYGVHDNYAAGANIVGFNRLVEAMHAQGIV